MGGFYERLLGVVKTVLKKVLGNLVFERVQLEALLMEVEYVVNSKRRPHCNDSYTFPITFCKSKNLSTG